MSLAADRLGRQLFLILLSLMTALGGIALALAPGLPVLLIVAFIGMLNGTGTDRSAAFALDQAIVPGLVAGVWRTWSLAWYNVFLDGGGSLGAWPLLCRFSFSTVCPSRYSAPTDLCFSGIPEYV